MKQVNPVLTVVYSLAIVLAILVGLGMPRFYDWTGADQSRPAPIVGYIAIGLLVACLLAWIALLASWWTGFCKANASDLAPAMQEQSGTSSATEAGRVTSSGGAASIWKLLSLTTAAAIVAAGVRLFPVTVSALTLLFAFGRAGWSICAWSQYRLPLMAVFAWMWFPYLWLIASSPVKIEGLYRMVAFIATVPAFLPSLLIGRSLGARAIDEYWVGCLCTGVSVLIATWAVHKSSRWSLAYLLLTLFLSLCGSFALHALLRA